MLENVEQLVVTLLASKLIAEKRQERPSETAEDFGIRVGSKLLG